MSTIRTCNKCGFRWWQVWGTNRCARCKARRELVQDATKRMTEAMRKVLKGDKGGDG